MHGNNIILDNSKEVANKFVIEFRNKFDDEKIHWFSYLPPELTNSATLGIIQFSAVKVVSALS